MFVKFLKKFSKTNLHQFRFFNKKEFNNIQESYLNEPCIRVNNKDEPLGMISKNDCHKNSILHRAFSIFLFNSKKELLLQKRSDSKITFPNVWTNSCCSHPHFNEFEMDTKDEFVGIKRAGRRKLEHELGIKKINDLHVMGRFIYKADYDSQWSEHELDYAIVIPNCDESINYNANEVCEIRFVKEEELYNMMENKLYDFSPWFKLFTKKKFLQLWWSNLDNLTALKDLEKIHTF